MGGGTYLLGMRLDKRAHLAVGRLGRFVFPAGYYVYAGSAQGPGGLPARLARHRRREKRRHWHVDYLLARARLVEVWTVVSSQRLECAWAQAMTGLPGAQVLVPRFGASDCRCPAHLVYFSRPPEAGRMTATLQRSAGQAVTVRHHVEARMEEKNEGGREKKRREKEEKKHEKREERHEKGEDAGDRAGWLRALIDGDEDAREEAAYALGALGAASVPPLLELLENGDADVRCWAMWALAHTGSHEAVQPLMAALDEADDEVRTCAAMALGELRAAEAAPALVAQLEGTHGLLVRCAADALEKIGEEAVPDLVKALAHPKSQVRMWATRALGRIGSTAAVEPLCHVYLYDDSYLAQHYAEEALRDMGLLDIVLLA